MFSQLTIKSRQKCRQEHKKLEKKEMHLYLNHKRIIGKMAENFSAKPVNQKK
jgi:hypothetical protein